MTRLPQSGGDDGIWGDILNQYLLVSHNTDGTIKDGTVQESQLSSAVQAKLNGGGVSGVSTVNGRGGAVTLTKSDVGLANVDNTADVNKSVASAAKLTTSRTISLTGGVTGSASFDGSANVSISTTVASAGQLSLVNMAPGTSFDVFYNGSGWTYAGSVIASRPTSRTDLTMQCVNAIDDTIPSFAITGDRLLRVS